MAVFASTTSYSDPIRALTIKALEQRQAAQAAAAAKEEMPTSLPSPWQGASLVAGKLADAFQQSRTENALAAGRAELSKIMAGIGPEGPNPQQLAGIMSQDPDLGKTFATQAFEARQKQMDREQQSRENAAQRTLTASEGAAGRALTASEGAAGRALTSSESALTREQQTKLAEAKQEFDAAQADLTRAHQSGLQSEKIKAEERLAAAKEKFDLAVQANTQTFQQGQQRERLAVETAKDQPEVVKLKKAFEAGEIDKTTYDAAVKKLTSPGTAEQKAVNDTKDAYIQSGGALNQLKRAQAILAQGIDYGLASPLRTTLGQSGVNVDLPGLGKIDPEMANRTAEFNSLLNEKAIATMSAALRGATTDFELKQFITLLNDPRASPNQKARRLQEIINNEQAHHDERAKRITAAGQELPTLPGAVSPDTKAQPGGAPAAGEVQNVPSEAEALKLRPGTKFRLPDGRTGTAR